MNKFFARAGCLWPIVVGLMINQNGLLTRQLKGHMRSARRRHYRHRRPGLSTQANTRCYQALNHGRMQQDLSWHMKPACFHFVPTCRRSSQLDSSGPAHKTPAGKPGAITAFQPILSRLALPPLASPLPLARRDRLCGSAIYPVWRAKVFYSGKCLRSQRQHMQLICPRPAGVLPLLNGVGFIQHAIFV